MLKLRLTSLLPDNRPEAHEGCLFLSVYTRPMHSTLYVFTCMYLGVVVARAETQRSGFWTILCVFADFILITNCRILYVSDGEI